MKTEKTATPICDFVRSYAESGTVRAHMPGHKGAALVGPEALDITEIAGADELYGANGIIRESEQIAARLFGTGRTLYSAEGSSLCIRAMLYLALINAKASLPPEKRQRRFSVLAGRNAHRTLVSAAALLDLDIDWLPAVQDGLLNCKTDIRALDELLADAEERGTLPIAVYVTSPDYLGNIENIRSVAAVCHWHGVPLLVDNAHGAYLKFLPESLHPIDLGADICCDSAHKTLPCLTGAAYLHINRAAPEVFFREAERALALFASTSPSYLILQSLDAANRYLAEAFYAELAAFTEELNAVKARLASLGFTLIGNEKLKLTLAPKFFGYTGTELAESLRESGVECEFADPDYTVLMPSVQTGIGGLRRIEAALLSVKKRAAIQETPPELPAPCRVLTVREAVLAPQLRIKAELAAGRILGNDYFGCPPAVPITVPGERIGEEVLACFRYYGVTECSVTDG